jgi:hypothetical protein
LTSREVLFLRVSTGPIPKLRPRGGAARAEAGIALDSSYAVVKES